MNSSNLLALFKNKIKTYAEFYFVSLGIKVMWKFSFQLHE